MSLRTRTNTIAHRHVADQENAPLVKGKLVNGPVTRRAALGDITSNTLANRQRDAALKKDVPIKPPQVQNPQVIAKPLTSTSASSRLPRPKAVPQRTATVKPFPAGRTFGLPKKEGLLKPAVEEKTERPQAVVQPWVPVKHVEDIDKNDEGKLFLVPEYANDIYKYLRYLEGQYEVKENYLAGQIITARMRATLVDWLVDVQQQYHLFAETLHLCVAIIDMFLQKVTNVTRDKLQLVGVSAMMVACKYEETYSPDISDFVYITDSTYTKQEILYMEKYICGKLDFRLGRPLSLHFLRRYSKAANASSLQHSISKYFVELALLQYKLVHVKPSLVAAAACLISLAITDKKESSLETLWTDCLVHYSTYKLAELKPIIPKLANTILTSQGSKLQSVQKKYSSSKLQKVSLLPALESDLMKKLAEGS